MIIAGVSVLVVVLLVIFLSGVLTAHGPSISLTTTSYTSSVQSSSQVTMGSTTQASVCITVAAERRDSKWVRSSADDLPHYATGIGWNICNEGTATANDAKITVESDGIVVKNYTMALSPGSCTTAGVNFDYPYDTTHQIAVEAASTQSKDDKLLTIRAELPRVLLQPQGVPSQDLLEVAKLFITPNDPIVEETLKHAIREYQTPDGTPLFRICPDFRVTERCTSWLVLDAIGDWIHLHVTLDQEQDVSQLGYTQLPRETLANRHGSSADLAILEVSLARAADMNPGNIFVVLGTDGTATAWWVYDTVGRPFLPRPPSDFHRYGSILGVYYFNDQLVEMVA